MLCPFTLPSPSLLRETASNLLLGLLHDVLLIYGLCMVFPSTHGYVTTTVRFIHARIILAKVCLEAQLIG